jgi:hypothetical protein
MRIHEPYVLDTPGAILRQFVPHIGYPVVE